MRRSFVENKIFLEIYLSASATFYVDFDRFLMRVNFRYSNRRMPQYGAILDFPAILFLCGLGEIRIAAQFSVDLEDISKGISGKKKLISFFRLRRSAP